MSMVERLNKNYLGKTKIAHLKHISDKKELSEKVKDCELYLYSFNEFYLSIEINIILSDKFKAKIEKIITSNNAPYKSMISFPRRGKSWSRGIKTISTYNSNAFFCCEHL